MSQGIGCGGCKDTDATTFDIPFTMAFQPIVDLSRGRIWGYEALVRGQNGENAHQVLDQVTEANRYRFDQGCRIKAIELAGAKLPTTSDAMLAINFIPNAVYEPKACIRATLAIAAKMRFSPRRLMFEFTENEQIGDVAHVTHIVNSYKQLGFTTAIDDFGAGYAGLGLLAQFQPDIVKIDMNLVRDIDTSRPRQVIVAAIVSMCRSLEIKVLAEGVETREEMQMLLQSGVELFQGYYFARPELETFAREDDIPALASSLSLASSNAAA